MSDDPPFFDENEDNVIAMRHPETGAPVVIPREVALAESRAYRAYCDWLGGVSWEVIAARHEYADARAAQYDIRQYVESARSLYNSLTKQQAKALALARLETLMGAAWETAIRGNIPAINTAHALVASTIKLQKLDELGDDENEAGNHMVIVAGDEDTYTKTLEEAAKD